MQQQYHHYVPRVVSNPSTSESVVGPWPDVTLSTTTPLLGMVANPLKKSSPSSSPRLNALASKPVTAIKKKQTTKTKLQNSTSASCLMDHHELEEDDLDLDDDEDDEDDDEEEMDDKKRSRKRVPKRLERNRQSARLSRRRRKHYLERLEERVTALGCQVDVGRQALVASAVATVANLSQVRIMMQFLGQQLSSFSLSPPTQLWYWLTLQNDLFFRGGRASSERLSAARIGERVRTHVCACRPIHQPLLTRC
jgi:hypothetical protein